MATPNYLLGRGEELTISMDHVPSFGGKINPYDLAQAKEVIGPKAAQVSQGMKSLPPLACPNDEAVAVLTLHPSYLSKGGV